MAAARFTCTRCKELRDYCYTVAGIVGEMLTELFLLQSPSLKTSWPATCARAPSSLARRCSW